LKNLRSRWLSLKLYEYEAKRFFAKYGIPIPRGNVASKPEIARKIAEEIGGPVAVKVQVLVGGRGKAGGIKFADSPDEVEKVARNLLGSIFKGFKVSEILVEEKLNIDREFYLGVTVDRSARKIVAIASSMGGVEIEETARIHPELISKKYIDPTVGFYQFDAINMLKRLKFKGPILVSMARLLKKLYDIMVDYDAELVEINPLVLTGEGRLIAADARLNIDSDSLFRHEEFTVKLRERDLSKYEAIAMDAGLSYVELEGNIGIIGNGAGLVMATLDMVKLHGGSPANFLDVGGGASEEAISTALKILMEHENVKVIFVNILGGITRCDIVAKGLLSALNSLKKQKPIVIRLTGTMEEEGRKLLERNGLVVFSSMENAAKKAVELAEEVN